MSKEKPFEGKISSFYKKNCIDVMMFGWVAGTTEVLPAVSVNQAIEMFKKWVDLSEDDYPTNSAKITYSRIKQDFIWRKEK
jgi:hypothetical protein